MLPFCSVILKELMNTNINVYCSVLGIKNAKPRAKIFFTCIPNVKTTTMFKVNQKKLEKTQKYIFLQDFFTVSAPRLIQSSNRDVRLSVPLSITDNYTQTVGV